MYDNGPLDPDPTWSNERRTNPWVAAALTLGVIVAVVLLLMWGASASPSGGCGGG